MPRGDGTGPAGGESRGRGRGFGIGHGPGRGQGRGRRGKAGRIPGHPRVPANTRAVAPLGTVGPLEQANRRAGMVMQSRGAPKQCDTDSEAGGATPVAYVTEEECMSCGACQAVCSADAIMLGDSSVKVDPETCRGCGACVEVCPSGAISLV